MHVDGLVAVELGRVASEECALIGEGVDALAPLEVFKPAAFDVSGMMQDLARTIMRVGMHGRDDESCTHGRANATFGHGLFEGAADVVSNEFENGEDLLKTLEKCEGVLRSALNNYVSVRRRADRG